MSLIQQNRYDQLLRRVADLKGGGSKVSDALTELFPMIDVERVPGELLALGQTQVCLGSSVLTGAAAESSRIQVFNPVDSGKLVTVSTCIVSSNTTQLIRFATTVTAIGTNLGVQVFRDRRQAAASRPSAEIRQLSSAALTDAHGQFHLLANTPQSLNDENAVAVLGPGSGFEVGANTNVTQLAVTFFWRERVAEPSELNF